MHRLALIGTAILVGMLTLTACNGKRHGSYADGSAIERDIEAAKALYAEAREALADQDLDDAEALLRSALDADLYHGGAHNDLGVILLERGQLYDAAHEFEWARKLLPGHPDPRVNLAITLDRGQKPTEAIASARAALESRPNYLPAHQAAALIQLRHNLADEETVNHLSAIIEQSTDERWRSWAIQHKLRLDGRTRFD